MGWRWTTLGDVADVRGGVTKGRDLSRFETIDAPYLRVANVQAGYLDLREIKKIAIKRDELAKYQLRAGDVLFTEGGDRDKLARGTVWRDEIPCCIHQNHIFCARPRLNDVLPQWLSFASQLPASREYFWSVASQTVNLASISLTNLKAWPIPLPPLAEQRLIVERVEALLAQTRTAREALAPVSALVRRLRQAVLAAAFSGRLSAPKPGDEPTGEMLERIRAERALLGGRKGREEARALPEGLPELPEGWAWARLGDVITCIEAGRSPKNQGRPAWAEESGVLKVSAVSWGRFLPEENKALLPGDVAEPELTVRSGDLLISRANTTDLIGAVVYVSQDYPNLMLSDKTLRLVKREDAVESLYLLHVLRTQSARDFFASHATGTSDSMRNISQEKIRELLIPLAPLAEQRRIVARVEALLAHADVIEQAVAATSARIADVERAVLARAFRGELVSDVGVETATPL